MTTNMTRNTIVEGFLDSILDHDPFVAFLCIVIPDHMEPL